MNLAPSEQSPREAWSKRPVYAGVLVGGASTRMGQSKSLLRQEGTTFVERVLATVRKRAVRTVLLGEGPMPPLPPEVVRLPDVPGLTGPLAGMLAAMRWAPQACWLFAACDLPMLHAEALDWLLSQRRPGRWAVLPKVVPERVEPLLALYEPEALELLENLVAQGLDSPRHIAGEPTVCTPTPPKSLQDCWTNVNTPEERRRLERARREPPTPSQR
ncbi:MAG: molybdenum cofactor guanylyltransferase [Phycisphaerae bacterium]